MSLPKAVQQQADELAKYDQELMADANADDPIEEQPAGEQPAPPPTPEPQPPAAPPQEDPWKQRYQSLQGMFNAETARLSAEVAELRKTLATKEPEPARPAAQSPVISEEDREIFGDDLIELIGRKAAEVAAQMTGELKSEIKRLETVNAELVNKVGTVEQVQGNTAREDYLKRLTAMVPDWEQLNTDQTFLGWVGTADPLTNLTRQAYLEDAYNAFDVARTAAIFNAFKAQTGSATPAPASRPAPSLAAQVAPGNTGSAPAPASEGTGKVWTMREIDEFYASIQRGDWKGKEDAAAKREAEIDLAVQQGRLRD